MNQVWSMVPLNEVCEFLDRRGVTPKKLGSDFTDSGHRVISAKNIKGRDIELRVGDQRYVNEETYSKWMASPLFADDVLLTSEAPLGEPAYLTREQKWCLGQRLFCLRSDKTRLYGRFLFHAFQSPIVRRDMLSRATGATAQGIRQAELRKVVIPIPTLPEQKRIVAILDEAFEAIAKAKENAEKNLANAKELFDSYLNRVFSEKGDGWQTKTVGEIANHSLGKMLDKKKNKGVLQLYLRNKNVRWFEFDLDDMLEMKFEPEEESKYTAIHGDVLMCEGGYPGRAAIWDFDEPIFFQKAVHRIRFHEKSYNRWFVYFIYYSDVCGTLKQYFTGAGIQHFTGKALDRFSLPVPPNVRDVDRFCNQFDELRAKSSEIEKIIDQKVHALGELKRSILQKAFTGQLTSKSPELEAVP